MVAAEPGRAPVRVCLLGELRLLVDGRDVRPRGRKACGLIAYAAVAPGRAVSRERAADLLWSDRGSEQARASLRQSLAELRGAAPALRDAVAITRDTIALVPDRVRSDVDAILASARARSGEALAHDMGEIGETFLADLSGLSPGFDDWLLAERVRQHERVLGSVLEALPEMIGETKPMHIQAILRALDRLDPWNEAVARIGLAADHAAGDFASLHRRYRALLRGLAEEFGVEPSEETAALYRRLSTSEPGGDASPPAATPAPAAPPTMFVGAITALGLQRESVEIAAIITDDLRTALARHRDLRVLSLEASDAARVEQACGNAIAAYMLSGRVRQAGDQLRVNLQIGNIRTSTITWSDQITVDPGDLAGAIDRVVAKAAGAVLPTIDRDLARTALPAGSDDDVVLYARARRLIGAREGLAEPREGAALLEQIVARDPAHVGARVLLARMYNTDYWQRSAGHDVAALRGRALALAQEAAAIDPGDVGVQLQLAWCHLRQGHWLRAEHGLRQGAAALPFDPDSLNVCAFGLAHVGDVEAAEPLMQRAFQLNPFPPPDYHADYAALAMLRGDAASAEEHFAASGERGLQYLALRLANLVHLPAGGDRRRAATEAFLASFRAAWQRSAAPGLGDVLAWTDSTFPLRRADHLALLHDGLTAALAPSLPA